MKSIDAQPIPSEDADDAWRLWIALTEQAARSSELEAELASLKSSRSWRLTAPLRAAMRLLRPVGASGAKRCAFGADGIAPDRALLAAPWVSKVLAADDGVSPRWLVDVTMLDSEDLGAGVQRVTRRLLAEMLFSPPERCRIEPVRLVQGRYHHARRFLARFLGVPAALLGPDDAVQPRAHDRLLGLDFCRGRATELRSALEALRAAGTEASLVVHDVLPLSDPQWFPDEVVRDYESWLAVLSACGDRALCVSSDTAMRLRDALAERGLAEPACGLAVFPLGADMPPAPDAEVLPAGSQAARVLTVGTLEPRKGHAQALAAFELLWSRGCDVEWIIAGREGWRVARLAEALRSHPEAGRRLRWVEGPDDRVLASLYRRCDLLLAPSQGEGFGLPIVEAGKLNLDLLVRDIPVFREVAGDAATYFEGSSAEAIADAISAWLDRRAEANTGARHWATWAQSAEALKSIVAASRRPDSGSARNGMETA
ncbi:glycosyltransferase family 4 protein [Luteimonas gilva]|nr:glycosyltransferase family 1 protein [Luteimonas gilva]